MIKRYDLFQVHPCCQDARGELRQTADGEYVAFEDVQHFFGLQSETQDELFRRVASAIDDADFAFSLKLTRLVDGVSEYTVTFSDGTPPMLFPDTEDAYEYIRGRKMLAKAQAAIAALTPSHQTQMVVPAEEYNKAFDAANEALGGAFMAGFREGWIYAEIDADGERYQEMAEEYALAVDNAPQEAWDANRAEFFTKLPLAALPEVPDNG